MTYCYSPSAIPVMHRALFNYVKNAQGDKCCIFTDNKDCDKLYCLSRKNKRCSWKPFQVKAIRAIDEEKIQVLCDSDKIRYSEDDISKTDKKWRDIQHDDDIEYIPSLFGIIENIEQYV